MDYIQMLTPTIKAVDSFDKLLHPDYLDYVGDSSSRMDYLAQLELDIKKEQVDLVSQLAQGRNILRATQNLQISSITNNPVRRKIKIPENHSIKSINLIVCGEDLENKLCQILTNYYFEIICDYTKFSNTETLTSSRLFERYLSKYLDNQCDDIFASETRLSINIFDFRYAPINIPDLVLELYIQEKWNPSLTLYLEYIYEKIDSAESIPRLFIRPKNSSDFYLRTDDFKTTQLIRNSGYCFGMVLCLIPYPSDQVSYPSLEKILIYPQGQVQKKSDKLHYLEFGPDDFKTIETPAFKYVVLMFDSNYRSDENIAEMLDGYLFDSKKIHGLNFMDTTDPAINVNINDSDYESDEEEFSCCKYKLEFSKLDPHGEFRVNENFYYLDCVDL